MRGKCAKLTGQLQKKKAQGLSFSYELYCVFLILSYTIQYYTIPYCTVLFCLILSYLILSCAILYYAIVSRSIIYCIFISYDVLYHFLLYDRCPSFYMAAAPKVLCGCFHATHSTFDEPYSRAKLPDRSHSMTVPPKVFLDSLARARNADFKRLRRVLFLRFWLLAGPSFYSSFSNFYSASIPLLYALLSGSLLFSVLPRCPCISARGRSEEFQGSPG